MTSAVPTVQIHPVLEESLTTLQGPAGARPRTRTGTPPGVAPAMVRHNSPGSAQHRPALPTPDASTSPAAWFGKLPPSTTPLDRALKAVDAGIAPGQIVCQAIASLPPQLAQQGVPSAVDFAAGLNHVLKLDQLHHKLAQYSGKRPSVWGYAEGLRVRPSTVGAVRLT